MAKIREKRNLHGSETSLLLVFLGPLFVGEMRINRASNNLAIDLIELGESIRELADLSWAYEGEIEWVEEENNVLALELLEADLLELVLPPRHALEGRCWLSHSAHGSTLHLESKR